MSPLLYQLSYTARAAKLAAYGGRVKRGVGHCAQIVPANYFASCVLKIGGLTMLYRSNTDLVRAPGTDQRLMSRLLGTRSSSSHHPPDNHAPLSAYYWRYSHVSICLVLQFTASLSFATLGSISFPWT